MLNIKKTITVSEILFNNLVSLTLILIFCLLNNLHAQMPGDFPEGREFDPRHALDPRESGISPSAHKTKALVNEVNISENVELVGATGGAVYDVFVAVHEAEGCEPCEAIPVERSEQDNYAYVCAGGNLTILNVSAPSNPTKVGYVVLPDWACGVYVQGSFAYVADDYYGLRQNT